MILCIETSGEICSIAIAENIDKHIYAEVLEPNAHSRALFPLIDKTFKENNISKSDLKAIALSSGPGSYTGLRIGSAAAKSICMALEIPLITLSTLKIIASETLEKMDSAQYIVPIIDARRMEVYTAVFDSELNIIKEDAPHIISEETVNLWENKNVILAGSGAEKAFHFLKDKTENISIAKNIYPKAENMINLAFRKFNSKDFTEAINFEPAYLKPFYTTAKPIEEK